MGKKAEKITGLALAASLAAIWMLAPVPQWMGQGHVLRCALTHHFWHANAFHLAANCLALLAFAWVLPRWYRLLPAAYIAGSLSYFCALGPVIGVSNILFAMSGLCVPRIRGYWKRPETWVFLAVMAGMLAFPRLSATTHITAFALGTVFGFVGRAIRRTADDCRRARG